MRRLCDLSSMVKFGRGRILYLSLHSCMQNASLKDAFHMLLKDAYFWCLEVIEDNRKLPAGLAMAAQVPQLASDRRAFET